MRALITLAILFGAIAGAQENPPSGGPIQLIITYRCPPPRRAAFRQYMTDYGVQRFDRWKQDGILKEYKFLFNWYIDVDTWDAMAILNFPDYNTVGRWKDIEKTSPGGLTRDALEMAWPLNTYSADLALRETAPPPPDPKNAVYFIIPYDAASWRDSAISLGKGLLRENAASSYSAYSNRYAGGKRWLGLLVIEFKDLESFGRRDEALAKIRSQIKPAGEREPVIAESIGH